MEIITNPRTSALKSRRRRRLSGLYRVSKNAYPELVPEEDVDRPPEDLNATIMEIALAEDDSQQPPPQEILELPPLKDPPSNDEIAQSAPLEDRTEQPPIQEIVEIQPPEDAPDLTDSDSEKTTLRRSQRTRFRRSDQIFLQERPQSNNPKRLTENSSFRDIKQYYLDKKVKRLPPSLETIFEEPQRVKNEEVTMSSRKFKRVIDFSATSTNFTKIKKRKMKAKTVASKSNKRQKKLSMDFVKQKLAEADDE